MNQREKAQELYEQGHSPAEIEELTHKEIPANKVRAWKSRYKWSNGKRNNSVAQQRAQRNTATPSIEEQLVDAVEANEELEDWQKVFCLHYSRTFNATASYKRARPECAYNTAKTEGSVLLTTPNIRAEIQRLKKMRNMHMMATADDVVERMMQIAFVDLTDYVEWGRAEVPVMGAFGPMMVDSPEDPEGPKVTLTKEVNELRFKESSEVDGTLLSEVKQGRDGASVKTRNSDKALMWLIDYFELNPMDQHRKSFDEKRLALEAQKQGDTDETGGEIIINIVPATPPADDESKEDDL